MNIESIAVGRKGMVMEVTVMVGMVVIMIVMIVAQGNDAADGDNDV